MTANAEAVTLKRPTPNPESIKRSVAAAGFVMVPIDTTHPAAIGLRDWLAGMWLGGAAGHHNTPEITDEAKARRIAEQAYRVADAMLVHRRAAAIARRSARS